MQQIAPRMVGGEHLAQLLGRPVGGGMGRGVDVEDAPGADLHHHECVDRAERGGGGTTKSQATMARGEGRRIDFVVFDSSGERVIELVEVTSEKADKAAQALKEANICRAGRVYVRNKATGRVVEVTGIPTRLMRLP